MKSIDGAPVYNIGLNICHSSFNHWIELDVYVEAQTEVLLDIEQATFTLAVNGTIDANIRPTNRSNEDNSHHMPASGDGNAATYHAVRRYSPFIELIEFQECFVDIHLDPPTITENNTQTAQYSVSPPSCSTQITDRKDIDRS